RIPRHDGRAEQPPGSPPDGSHRRAFCWALTNLLMTGRRAAAVARHVDGARRRDRKPARLWLKGRDWGAREIGACQAAERALAAETTLGDPRLLWQRRVKFSARGRSMTFGP